MEVLKERCPSCGGTIILPPNASIGECAYCGATYSLSELQEIKEAITEEQRVTRENNCDGEEDEYYESALDTSEADEISIDELCQKSEMALESEQWEIANRFSNEILRRNPKFAKAYLYKLLAEHEVFKKEELANLKKPFDNSDNYRLLIRFANVYLKTEIENYSNAVNARYRAETQEAQYQALCSRMKTASTEQQYRVLADGFRGLGDYKDSPKLAAEYLKKFESVRRQARKKKIMISIAVIAALILGIVLIVAGNKAKYSSDNVAMTVVEKNREKVSSKNLYFTLVFEIENKGSLDVLQLVGNFNIYNTKGECLLTDTVTFNGILKPGNTLQYDLAYSLANSEKNLEIYETDLSGLKMTYQLTMIKFEGNKEKEYKNSDVITLCDVSKEYIDGANDSANTYESAIALFNQGKYAEALPLFKTLGDYKDSYEYYVKSVYHNGLALFSQGKYGDAYKALKEINGYEDAAVKMSEIASAALAEAETVAGTGDYAAACKIIEQVDFDEDSILHQAYTLADQGNFAEAVEYGLTVVVIPEGVETIPDNYFKAEYKSNDLKKVVLPSTLKRIGMSAFYGCTRLEEINLPDGLKTIGNYAFYKCISLPSVEIPDSVESMGAGVFRECKGLQSVSIPGTMKTVPSQAFEDCSGLTTVTLENGVEVLDISAFSGCTSLMNITLPDSLVKIESNVFYRCTSLLEITIPTNVNVITYSAFSNCSSLQRVYFANQIGWQYEYSGSSIDVTNAQENAKALRSVGSSTWERK